MQTERRELFLEDLEVGAKYQGASIGITLELIREFATEFDPQPFHHDEEAAKASFFGELVASGWMTAALTIRMGSQGDLRLAGGWIGLGIDSIVWPASVRPGDRLSVLTEVLETRASKSMPKHGVIKLRNLCTNQDGVKVCEVVSNQLVIRRG